MIYRNKHNGALYRHLAIATDKSHMRNGQLVVIYCPIDNEHTIYAWEHDEFIEKFEPVIEKQTMHEDELPKTMTDEEYDAWYAQSTIPDGGGCRIGPVFKK